MIGHDRTKRRIS